MDTFLAEERKRKPMSRQEALNSLQPKENDALAIAILHWYRIDLPKLCQQIKEIVKEIEMRHNGSQPNNTAPATPEARFFQSLDPVKMTEIYRLLDTANPRELFPYQFLEEEPLELPALMPMDAQTELIYNWICSDESIHYKAMYSITLHKAFTSAGIDGKVFREINDRENQQWESAIELAKSAGIDSYHHIDTDALAKQLAHRLDFNESVVILWKELRQRLNRIIRRE